MRFFTILLSLGIITTAAVAQLTSDGCYREYTNSKVNCMLSFLSQRVNSLEECGALCTKNAPKCKAAQMSTFPDTTCQLYDTALPVTGSAASAGRRKRLAGCYGYGPSIIYGQGFCYLLPTGYGCSPITAGPQTNAPPPTPPPATPPPPTPPPPTPPTQPTPPTDASTTTTQVVITDAPTTQASVSPSISDGALPQNATCPAGKEVRYTYVDGYKLSVSPDFTFQAATENDCLTACTNNRSPDGTQAPCLTADYNSKTQTCSVSMQITPPAGTTTATADADSKHFEKVCVTAAVAQNCPGAYFRSPQHILVGFAQAVTTATSTVDCLEQCATSKTRFNFACSSGMYYFDETTNNCILNSETRVSNPDKFIAENTDGVEYFESGCIASRRAAPRLRRQAAPTGKRNRNVLQLNSNTFSAWTMCDGVQHSHMRFKHCTALNPNRCQIDLNGCDPAKEDEYDRELNARDPVGKLQQVKKSPSKSQKPKFDSPPDPKRATRVPKSGSTTPLPKGGTTPKASSPIVKAMPAATGPSNQTMATSPKPPGECVPVIKEGRVDCTTGLRLLPNGKKDSCDPSNHKNCADKKKENKGTH